MGCKRLASIFLLSLFLFVSVLSQIPLVKAQIFSDGFESGDFGAWSTSGTCNIIENPVHHGTYAANVTGYFYKSGLTSTSDAFGRCYVYLEALPPSGVTYVISKMYDSGWGSDYVGAIVTNDSGVMKFGLDLASGNYFNSTEVFIDTWYAIEYERDVTLGDARLWVDGVLWLEDTSETMAGDTVTFMGTSGDSETWAVISDCYVFDSSYIGVEVEGQDLSFPLFENFNVFSSLSRGVGISRTLFENPLIYSSLSKGRETGNLFFENSLVYSSMSRGMELSRMLFENPQIWSSITTSFELAVLDLTFILFENPLIYPSLSRGIEIARSLSGTTQVWSSLTASIELSVLDLAFILFENTLVFPSLNRGIEISRSLSGTLQVWSSLATATEGVFQDLTFTLFETVMPLAVLISDVAEAYVLADALALAAIAFVLAIVAICLLFAFKKES